MEWESGREECTPYSGREKEVGLQIMVQFLCRKLQRCQTKRKIKSQVNPTPPTPRGSHRTFSCSSSLSSFISFFSSFCLVRSQTKGFKILHMEPITGCVVQPNEGPFKAWNNIVIAPNGICCIFAFKLMTLQRNRPLSYGDLKMIFKVSIIAYGIDILFNYKR